MISLFSADDMEMISSKSGKWWENNPQRGRSNNSAVLLRHRVTKEFFMDLWERIKASGSGEPGIYFNNDKDWGTNPCAEIALRPYHSSPLFPACAGMNRFDSAATLSSFSVPRMRGDEPGLGL